MISPFQRYYMDKLFSVNESEFVGINRMKLNSLYALERKGLIELMQYKSSIDIRARLTSEGRRMMLELKKVTK